MMRKIGVILVFLFFIILDVQNVLARLPTFSHTYFFGDSLSDVGNYVELKPKACVRVSAPVTNPVGGQIPATIWANNHAAGFDATASKNGGNDWALAGSLTSHLPVEVNEYLQQNKTADPEALYVIWIGSNDVMEKIYEHFICRDKVITDAMDNIKNSITTLYQAGARNFLIIGVPDISVTPLVASRHINFKLYAGLFHILSSSIRTSCMDWNATLFNQVENDQYPDRAPLAYLAKNLPNIRFYIWDPIPLLQKATANPAQYGFPNALNKIPNRETMWCNGASPNSANPDSYIFFNYIHPSAKAHEMLAQHIRAEADLFYSQSGG